MKYLNIVVLAAACISLTGCDKKSEESSSGCSQATATVTANLTEDGTASSTTTDGCPATSTPNSGNQPGGSGSGGGTTAGGTTDGGTTGAADGEDPPVTCDAGEKAEAGFCVTMDLAEAKTAADCHAIAGYFYGSTCHTSKTSCVLGKKTTDGETCVAMTFSEATDAANCHAITGHFYSSACHASAIACAMGQLANAAGEACAALASLVTRPACLDYNGFWYDSQDVLQSTTMGFDGLTPSCHAAATDGCPSSNMLTVGHINGGAMVDGDVDDFMLSFGWSDLDALYSTLRCFPSVVDLYLEGNNALAEVDVSNNRGLKYLWLYNSSITSIDLSKNLALLDFDCGSCTALTTLDVSHNTNLVYLGVSDPLTSLSLKGLTKMKRLYAHLSGMSSLDLSDQKDMNVLDVSGSPLTALDLSAMTKLQDVNISNTGLNLANLGLAGKPLTNLRMTGLYATGIPFTLPTSLELLDVSDNNLASLNLAGLAKLEWVYAGNNNISSLNLSGCTKLSELSIYDNALTTLDVSPVGPALETLNAGWNSLNSVNLTAATQLSELYLESNNLGAVNLAANTQLKRLSLSYNIGMTSLSLATNTMLEQLWLEDVHGAGSLDLHTNTALTDVDLAGSYWSGFDLTGSAALYSVALCMMPNLLVLDFDKFNPAFIASTTVDGIFIEDTKWAPPAGNAAGTAPAWANGDDWGGYYHYYP